MLTSEALPVIGVPPVSIGAMRSMGVSAYTVTFWRYPAANPEDRSLSCRFRSDCFYLVAYAKLAFQQQLLQ